MALNSPIYNLYSSMDYDLLVQLLALQKLKKNLGILKKELNILELRIGVVLYLYLQVLSILLILFTLGGFLAMAKHIAVQLKPWQLMIRLFTTQQDLLQKTTSKYLENPNMQNFELLLSMLRNLKIELNLRKYQMQIHLKRKMKMMRMAMMTIMIKMKKKKNIQKKKLKKIKKCINQA